MRTLAALSAFPLAASLASAASLETLSPVYEVKRIYRSMQGPSGTQTLKLAEGPRRLVWLTGFRTEVVDEHGRAAPDEFMCHANLDLDHAAMRSAGGARREWERLATLSQGATDLELPEGFAFPLLSDEPMTLVTQVLNLNRKDADLRLRQKVTLEFLEDRQAKGVRPLFHASAFALRRVPSLGQRLFSTEPEHDKLGCLPGEPAVASSVHRVGDAKYTGHWTVEPGRQVTRTRVTDMLAVPYDTTIHHAIAHLHPYAESLELFDVTEGRTVLKLRAENARGRTGLTRVESFSSAKGLPVFKGHQYELVSVYDNPSGEEQDAMAVLLLFLQDKRFDAGAVRRSLDLKKR